MQCQGRKLMIFIDRQEVCGLHSGFCDDMVVCFRKCRGTRVDFFSLQCTTPPPLPCIIHHQPLFVVLTIYQGFQLSIDRDWFPFMMLNLRLPSASPSSYSSHHRILLCLLLAGAPSLSIRQVRSWSNPQSCRPPATVLQRPALSPYSYCNPVLDSAVLGGAS